MDAQAASRQPQHRHSRHRCSTGSNGQMSSQVNAGQADAAGAQGTQFNTAQMQQKANEYMQQGMEAAGNAWKNLLGKGGDYDCHFADCRGIYH